MSERGSFCTEYIYCSKCFEALKSYFSSRIGKYLCGRPVASWEDASLNLPIIAGKVGGLRFGEETSTFVYEIIPDLEQLICHQVRIAVIPESGNGEILTANPIKGEVNERGKTE